MSENLIYLSYFLNRCTPAYGGEKDTIKFEKTKSIGNGDTSNNLKISFPNHIGTHIDFPFHFSDSGKKCNDYPASFWVFNKVGFLNCNLDQLEDQLENLSSDIELLILKTGFAKHRNEETYWKEQPVLASKFASIFRSKFPFLRVFGFDMISLTSKLDRVEGKLAHISFLIENDILILEDMNLENLSNTPSTVIISPLQLEGADGGPCNVIAIM